LLIPAKRVPLREIFRAFATIGLTSFGGGVSGWMYREFVEQRGWLSEEEFLSSFALCQAMPGVNVVNLAVWIGFRLRGTLGALAGFVAIIFPPLVVTLILGALYGRWGQLAVVHHALAGAAAVAIALSLNMGLRATASAARNAVAIGVLLALFMGIGIMQLPMLPLVLALAPISLGAAFLQERAQ